MTLDSTSCVSKARLLISLLHLLVKSAKSTGRDEEPEASSPLDEEPEVSAEPEVSDCARSLPEPLTALPLGNVKLRKGRLNGDIFKGFKWIA